MSASGLSRKMLLSSDVDCILNNEVSLSIDMVSLNSFIELRNTNGIVKIKSKQLKNKSIELNDTFFELIPIKELLQQIKVETKYTKDIEGDFIVEDMEYYYISLPEIIMDGTKQEIINYKNFKMLEIDKVSTDDKKLFISKINALRESNIEP